MAFHKDATPGDGHIIHNWEYADLTTRDLDVGFTALDVGKVCRILDSNDFYILINFDVVTWRQVTSTIPIPGGDPGDVISPTLFFTESGSTPSKLTEVFIKFAGGTIVSLGSAYS